MELMEHVKRPLIDGVKLQVVGSKNGSVEAGCMCVTAFHLIYSTRKQTEQDEITVLHTAIDHIDHKAISLIAVLVLKDFRRLLFEFQTPEDCQDMVDALEALSKPEHLQQLYAFTFAPRDPLPCSQWQFRTLLDLFTQWQCSTERFRISQVNRDFKVCSSYPEEVIVPSIVTDEDIKKVASFRHLGRFPVVCFHHKKTKAVLLRCGQPLCGPSHKKCKEDVTLLNACLPSLSKGKVMDIRPPSVAQSHMSKGGGIEYPSHYSQWKVENAKMETPANMQQSLNKLIEACCDASLATSSAWFGKLEASGWLEHISKLLHTARFISLAIHKDGSSVVVHGAGSRDATLQVTSLAQVLLDHHCRTMKGFIELVQREWLDGGHPFSIRHKHGASVPEKDKAPVFLLFLDAVWQVMQQYPLSFEFNEKFLHTLFVNSYYSVYGNFLYDNPKERVKNKLHEKTHSLWDHLAQPEIAGPMTNPLYEKNSSLLLITVTALNVTLWKRLYLRHDAKSSLTLPDYEAVKALKDTNVKLKEALSDVKRQLEEKQLEGRKFAANWS